ncbi:SA1788 family PVL leukocidin-associated protein [Staphylococcus sp. GDY8P120P]|uniref:SA1788 family PVL leukocidin-associated protein n=1 Tax=Staphylococcus sp. GDY8P120P TaxID=2804156 RepID=UPI001AEBB4C1|nr:SA1788 family PVL leukocidin-associated protein [Staphylococcus sp. GDY8P120P]
MKTITIFGMEYDILGENLKSLEKNGITDKQLRVRLLNGWAINEACKVPIGMRVKDYRLMQAFWNEEEDNEEAKQNYHDEKQREERPWLYDGTPQNHNRGKWCEYLMNTSIFPKVVR